MNQRPPSLLAAHGDAPLVPPPTSDSSLRGAPKKGSVGSLSHPLRNLDSVGVGRDRGRAQDTRGRVSPSTKDGAKTRDPVEVLLREAAEAVFRKRGRRPAWLPAGYPMQLVLTQRRERLAEFIVEDISLQSFLRRRWRNQLGVINLGDAGADGLQDVIEGSADPAMVVVAALLHPSHDVAKAAIWWVADPGRVPAPTLPARPEEVHQESEAQPEAARGEVGTQALSDLSLAVKDGNEPEDDHYHREVEAERAARLVAEGKLDEIGRQLDVATRQVRQLEALNLELQAQVPSRADRRRVNKDRGELQRIAGQLASVTHDSEALREERDDLLHRLRRAEADLEEAIESRKTAERNRRSLEQRLSTPSGRAEYLRRSLEAELEAALVSADKLTGRDRTRNQRRVEDLRQTRDLLDVLYPTEAPAIETAPPDARPTIVVGASRDLRVLPLGGAEEIGGSCVLVAMGDRRILVDAGMRPDGGGPRELETLLRERKLDAIVVTHAHNDHAGYIPALLQRPGFRNTPVLASSATVELLPTMWEDSARVMRRTYEEALEGAPAPTPLYGEAEVEEAERHLTEMPFHRARRVGDLDLTLFPAGHILGAAGVVIAGGGRRVVITGDITAPTEQHLAVEATHLPLGLVRGADLLVIESTYCHGDHLNRQHEVSSLVDTVTRVVERGGRVLIPAFGLGRAQEVAMILGRELPDVEVLVDGLARAISHIYEDSSARASNPMKIFTGRVRPVENRQREMRTLRAGVVVSTSGMLNGGPAVQWAQAILPESNDALLLCGYQDEDAPGWRLENLAQSKNRHLDLPDMEEGIISVPVRAQVHRYKLSAHADRAGLIEITTEISPTNVMLVHGFPKHQQDFRHELARRGQRPVPTATLQI